jgi:hypothetical protein
MMDPALRIRYFQTFILTLITLTVCIVHLPLLSKQKCHFRNTKSVLFFNVTLFEKGLGVRLKLRVASSAHLPISVSHTTNDDFD